MLGRLGTNIFLTSSYVLSLILNLKTFEIEGNVDDTVKEIRA